MPITTAWVEPEVFLSHNEVTVYHTYKDDDVDQGTNTFSFTTSCISDEKHFDVRNLDVPAKAMLDYHPPFLSAASNPAFATATEEQKADWQNQWTEWQRNGGGRDQAIKVIIKEAIDLGLIKASDDE